MNFRRFEQQRVLIVDDEPSDVRVLAEALRGMQLSFATDGARALELAMDESPDLILLDIEMAGMNGYTVLRWLKAEPRTRETPVIFVTSHNSAQDEAKGLLLGAVDYIVKPFVPAVVRARVLTHLMLKHQRDLLVAYAPVDSLTGLANRRGFLERLDRSWRDERRRGGTQTVLLIAVDAFAAYAEHYGHSPAEELLQRVAQALEQAFHRATDVVAYVDHGVYAVAVADADGHNHMARAFAAIHGLAAEYPRSEVSIDVTISGGATTRSAGDDTSAEALLSECLELLTQAREEGGNRFAYMDLRRESVAVVLGPGATPPAVNEVG